jgi:hypothetical protein
LFVEAIMPLVIEREQTVEQFTAGGLEYSVAHALRGVVAIMAETLTPDPALTHVLFRSSISTA